MSVDEVIKGLEKNSQYSWVTSGNRQWRMQKPFATKIDGKHMKLVYQGRAYHYRQAGTPPIVFGQTLPANAVVVDLKPNYACDSTSFWTFLGRRKNDSGGNSLDYTATFGQQKV